MDPSHDQLIDMCRTVQGLEPWVGKERDGGCSYSWWLC